MNMILSDLEQVFRVTPFTVITTLLVLLLTILYLILKDRNLPPGPIGLPLIGYWPFLKEKNIHVQLEKFEKKYGDVFSIRVAGKLFIVLGSIKAIKEAFVTKSDSFAGRLTDYSALSITFGKGLVTRNGEEWKVLRKFFIQCFRDYGITSFRDYTTGPIYDSVNSAIASLKQTKGSAVSIISILNNGNLAILRRLMFNENEVPEKEILNILDCYGKVSPLFVGKRLFLVGDFARKYLHPRIEQYEEVLKVVQLMDTSFKKIIKRHEETFDKNYIRDIIDSYIKERKDREDKGDPSAKYFSEDGLVGTLAQFVGDGISTVAMFTAYFIKMLLEHPEEQDKIYKELEDVVGAGREVTIEDKSNLPYTNAFMNEVLRTMDFFTHTISLECTKETTLKGYKIPVGAITVTNFWTSHHDPLVFEEPYAFKPSRYMTVKGKPKTELPVIFGVGKRSCPGESFAMMQVFLFLTTIVKHFRLARPEGDSKKSLHGEINICAYPRE